MQLKIQQADYEMDPEVTLSCEENWGGDAFAKEPPVAKKLAEIADELLKETPGGARILDLNAGTGGRLAFELAVKYPDVTALDLRRG